VDTAKGTTIDHYRVYYGPDPEMMFSTVDTEDSSTTASILNLPNESTFFFRVVAVDSNDHESEAPSETVNAKPESAEEELFNASVEEDQEEEAQDDALNTAVEEEDTPHTGSPSRGRRSDCRG
jgi:hypothetical protein